MGAPKDPIKYAEWKKRLIEAQKQRAPASEETRRKLSVALTGRIFSDEHRRNISEAAKKRKLSQETRRKISEAGKGRAMPEKTRLALLAANIGNKHNFGKHRPEEVRRKISESHKGEGNPFYGKHHTEESRKKKSVKESGENNPNWRGGVSFEPYCQKFTKEFKERVRAFFGYRCVECGTPQNGTKLHVHHVSYNKKVCCDDAIPLFVPLCHSCHTKTGFNREYWRQHFTEMINQYYGGKCYLTKEEMELL